LAKVFFISPPYVGLYGKLSRAAGRYFPLGLGYLAAYLRHYGRHQVLLFEPEAQNLSYAGLAKILKAEAPDVVGLTCSTPNFYNALKLARIIRVNCRAKIVLGGVHASAIPEFIIDAYSDLIDFVIVGEGEQTMLDLVGALEKGTGGEGIRGVVYKNGGKTIRNEIRPYIEDLDAIPNPARDLMPQNLFWPNLHNARYKNCLTIMTSRGCPYNCSFCAARIVSGRRYRAHSAGYVLAEMQMLKKTYGARQLLITDDTFTIDRARLEKICRGMIERKLNLAWLCFSQVNTVDKESLALMKKAGCYSIGFGLESCDREILKRMGKPIDPQIALKTVHDANALGLKTQAFYILGSPGETREQMRATIEFANKVNATLSFFNMLVPFPGTKDFDYFFAGVPLKEIEWENFVAVGEKCVLKNSLVPAREIEQMIARANANYYLNPKRMFALLRQIRTPYELSNYFKAGLALLEQFFSVVRPRRGYSAPADSRDRS
jgi:radical SAM superfamily enzyme YgiQ (UPF0313 family)